MYKILNVSKLQHNNLLIEEGDKSDRGGCKGENRGAASFFSEFFVRKKAGQDTPSGYHKKAETLYYLL